MAGTPTARGGATQAQQETNDWVKDRRVHLQAQQQAEAAGRQAWASSTRTGENLQAPQPADVRALGSRGARTPPTVTDNSDASSSPIQAVSDAFLHFQKGPAIPRPNLAESFIPVVGPGWEAVADLQQGNYGAAALNGALAASDLFLASAITKGLGKGGVYIAKEGASYSWPAVREWMRGKGLIEKGLDGHHWFFHQNRGLGKRVPEWIKNQPPNIMPLNRVTHGRLDHKMGDLPRFGLVDRIRYGTPTWAKATAGLAADHSVAAVEASSDEQR